MSVAWDWPGGDVRAPVGGDRDAIAALLLDAYRGTVDDEGEDDAEALQAADHYLSRCRAPASLLVVTGDAVVAMSFVVVVKGRHYIDPVATAVRLKGRGLGRAIVHHSLSLLASEGIGEVGAVITDGNEASERLFRSLGFVRVGAWG